MLWVLGIISLVIVAFLLFLILFEPGLKYHVRRTPQVPLESDHYLALLGALADAQVHGCSEVEVLANGEKFYEAELEAIRAAERHVHLEAYIFERSEIAQRFVDALTERARTGVTVRVVLDYIGSFGTSDSMFNDLRAAGGCVEWYQPVRWYTFKRLNNRTHRELLIVDGKVGFIGGAGISDMWAKPTPKHGPRWRDTVFRVHGPLVTGLQTTFAENWLESCDEILAGEDIFPCARKVPEQQEPLDTGARDRDGQTRGLVVISSPSAGRATRARVVFQTLLASATRSIDITSPYFLPDRSTRREMIRAMKDRGVRMRVLVPGDKADHAMTRRSSRRRYGELLENGAEIHEYQPAMIHEKMLVVDGVWSVVGSTNFDNRSFGINDEVNLAANGRELAQRLSEDFERDLGEAHRVTLEEWKRRPIWERVGEWAGMLLERQQ